jgi:hypothetical protein
MTNRSTRNLFHTKTLNIALRAFSFPQDMEARHQKLRMWIAALQTGTLDEVKEVSLHGSFLNDVFQDVLGYRSVIQGAGKSWEIHAEQTISDGDGAADGAMASRPASYGFFTATENAKGKVKLHRRLANSKLGIWPFVGSVKCQNNICLGHSGFY